MNYKVIKDIFESADAMQFLDASKEDYPLGYIDSSDTGRGLFAEVVGPGKAKDVEEFIRKELGEDPLEWMQYIPYGVYYNNKDLNEIVLPKHIEALGYDIDHGIGPFSHSNISKVVFPENFGEVDLDAFINTPSVKEIVIPNGTTQIIETDLMAKNKGRVNFTLVLGPDVYKRVKEYTNDPENPANDIFDITTEMLDYIFPPDGSPYKLKKL